MNALRLTGAILIVLGLAGFFTGGFSFTKETTQAKLGPLELTVKDKESVNVPQWLSLGAIALGPWCWCWVFARIELLRQAARIRGARCQPFAGGCSAPRPARQLR